MSDAGLMKSLRDGLTPTAWYQLLNGLVFFWVSEGRLLRLLGARAYRTKRQCILELDTQKLLAVHSERVVLSPINSGCTKPNPTPRGNTTFLPISTYPYESWLSKRARAEAVVELAVRYSVPDVRRFTKRVYEIGGDREPETLYTCAPLT